MGNQLPSGKVIATGQGEPQFGKPIASSTSEVDIDFVFDTTGSMDDKIQALLATCRQFVDEARKLGLDPYFSLTSFGDLSVEGGGDRIELVVPLTGNIEGIKPD